MFDPFVRETPSQHIEAERVAAWLPALAGLVASGCVAWWICPEPAPNSLTWPGLIALAARYVLLSAAAGLAAALGTTVLLLQGNPHSINLRAIVAMLWLPPLALFLSQQSPWAALASLVVGWQFAKSSFLPSQRRQVNPVTSAEPFQTFPAIDSFPAVPCLEAICSAVCTQSGAVAAMLGRPIESAALVGIGSGLMAFRSNKLNSIPESRAENVASRRRALAILALAIAFTLAGLMQYMRGGGSGDEVAGAGRGTSVKDSARSEAGLLSGKYKGVILLSEPVQHTVLVPPLPFMTHGLFSKTRPNPLSVPFFGVYWMFRWPQKEPPPNSYVVRGSPLTSVFRSSDRFPLSMEAHQNFGTLIDVSCCSKIQVAISSAEVDSRFIALELVLTNTTLSGKNSVSLGKAVMGSALDGSPVDGSEPVQAVLSFDVPRNPKIREFDEATILFHRGLATASAKIAIDRFVFVPRGF